MEKIIVIYIPKEKLIFLLYKDPLEIRKKKNKTQRIWTCNSQNNNI